MNSTASSARVGAKKSIIYLRATNSQSISLQLTACRQFLKANDLTEVGLTWDVAGGSSTPANLRNLVDELTRKRSAERRLLVMDSTSRLGRSMHVVKGLMERLSKAGVDVVFVKEVLP